MNTETFTNPLEDKKVAEEIRKMAADQIKWLLSQTDQMLLPDEKKLKYDILKGMAPNLFPKLKFEEEIPEEETKLTAEEQEHLNQILNG